MIKTRIATTAALFSFGLASFGGVVVAIAAPAHADAETTITVDGTAMDSTAGQAVDDARSISGELEDATRGSNVSSVPTPGSAATGEHIAFPLTPASPHDGQGKKGSNEQPHSHFR
ncbi:hypothetical protein TUM20985_52630 [Mycobacterium antarcticum]|uniref:hypothetical protein n=1 Tax=unclassified Mycolicibacterium TaxID=2636767 RepID=UPI00238EB4D9|nr:MULTISPECIES: hypothetical protein [unclassified Mycolicibacterium]BDX34716.1 hypothetical protein TUM20985_52630 [Mycolicibacterium sp. TUM20985]GLP77919.1 hypothetical protein TUM20983_50290 [Mycolicibacterium sp. TUM20983]GLP81676.1 hypothetical protein TUM20984_30960 [Mycolicibacterium sp. TUM20984]